VSAPLSIDQINEHTYAAVAAYHAQDNGTARALCEAILQTQAHHPYALNLLGVIHMDAGDLPAALALFERGVHHHPEWSQILNSLAVCQQRMGDACAALASYRKLLTLSPDDVQAKNNLHGLLSTQVQQGIHHWIKLALDCY
jgi:Flp pilus assembly protein TadD